jgi:phosphatidylglycerophosphate synthase
MIDDALRRVKDRVYLPVARQVGKQVSPMAITLTAGAVGLAAAAAAWQGNMLLGLGLWWGNRILDGLDGSVARASKRQTDLGGYIDTLVDFTMYTVIPIGLTLRAPSLDLLFALVFLLGTFYINAGAFLYLSSILERRKQGAKERGELTSVTMPRGIVEGTEAIIMYSLFFLLPQATGILFVVLGGLVLATTTQHIIWASRNLK